LARQGITAHNADSARWTGAPIIAVSAHRLSFGAAATAGSLPQDQRQIGVM
jgi:hypothetical protein